MYAYCEAVASPSMSALSAGLAVAVAGRGDEQCL